MAEVSSNVQNLLITAFLLLSFDKSMSFITVKNYQYLLTKHVLKHSFYHYSDLFEMLLKQIKYQQSKAAVSAETEVWLLIEIGTLFLFTFALWFFSQNFKFIATRGQGWNLTLPSHHSKYTKACHNKIRGKKKSVPTSISDQNLLLGSSLLLA